MPLGIIFWVLMIVWAVFGFIGQRLGTWAPYGGTLLLFILLFILGWSQFGFIVQG
jgi:hypothetical protein